MKSQAAMLCLIFCVCSALPTELRAETVRAEDADEKIKKALSRKVSFEFTDTPLLEAFDSVRHLCNVSLIIDPKAIEGREKLPITVRVNDMEMGVALAWILKLAELQMKVQDHAIFICAPDVLETGLKPLKEKEVDADAGHGILRARFASGDAIEIDAAMLRHFPHLSGEILALAFDPAKDGILVLSERDIPAEIGFASFLISARTVAPEIKFTVDEKLKLLFVRSDNAADLRRVNAIARALRRMPPNGPPGLPRPPPPPAPPLAGREDANPKITLKVADQPLRAVLEHLGALANVHVLAGDKDAKKRFGEPITLDLNDMDVRECFDMVAQLTELRYEVKGETFSFLSAAPRMPPPAAPVTPTKPPRAEPEVKEKPKMTKDGELQF